MLEGLSQTLSNARRQRRVSGVVPEHFLGGGELDRGGLRGLLLRGGLLMLMRVEARGMVVGVHGGNVRRIA